MKSEFHPVIRIRLALYIIFITKQRYFDADLRLIETFEVYLKTNEFEVNDFLFSNIDQEERLLFAKFIEDFVQKFLGHDKANCNFKDFWKWLEIFLKYLNLSYFRFLKSHILGYLQCHSFSNSDKTKIMLGGCQMSKFQKFLLKK